MCSINLNKSSLNKEKLICIQCRYGLSIALQSFQEKETLYLVALLFCGCYTAWYKKAQHHVYILINKKMEKGKEKIYIPSL